MPRSVMREHRGWLGVPRECMTGPHWLEKGRSGTHHGGMRHSSCAVNKPDRWRALLRTRSTNGSKAAGRGLSELRSASSTSARVGAGPHRGPPLPFPPALCVSRSLPSIAAPCRSAAPTGRVPQAASDSVRSRQPASAASGSGPRCTP
eukprot:2947215-Rhodomonas_salina.1